MDMRVLEVGTINRNSQKGCEVGEDWDFIVDGFLGLWVRVGNRRHIDIFWAIGMGVERVIVNVECSFVPLSFPTICSLEMISAACEEIEGWQKGRR